MYIRNTHQLGPKLVDVNSYGGTSPSEMSIWADPSIRLSWWEPTYFFSRKWWRRLKRAARRAIWSGSVSWKYL